jgi:hypothetical protein
MNREVEEKIEQNLSLEDQLNTAEGLSIVLRHPQHGNDVPVIFSDDLAQWRLQQAKRHRS